MNFVRKRGGPWLSGVSLRSWRRYVFLAFLLSIAIPSYPIGWIRIVNDTSFYSLFSWKGYQDVITDKQAEVLIPPGGAAVVSWFRVNTLENVLDMILNGSIFVKKGEICYKVSIQDILGETGNESAASFIEKEYEAQKHKGYNGMIVSLSDIVMLDKKIERAICDKSFTRKIVREEIVLWFDSQWSVEIDLNVSRCVLDPYSVVLISSIVRHEDYADVLKSRMRVRIFNIRSEGLLSLHDKYNDWGLSIDALLGNVYLIPMKALLESPWKEIITTNEGERWIVVKLGSYISAVYGE